MSQKQKEQEIVDQSLKNLQSAFTQLEDMQNVKKQEFDEELTKLKQMIEWLKIDNEVLKRDASKVAFLEQEKDRFEQNLERVSAEKERISGEVKEMSRRLKEEEKK